MSVNYVDKSTGDLIRVAGQGKAEYGASTERKGDITIPATTAGNFQSVSVVFAQAMPDNDYAVVIDEGGDTWAHGTTNVTNKTATGFTLFFLNVAASDAPQMTFKYRAFKLYTDTEYNNLLNNAVLTSDVTDAVTSGDMNPVTSNAVYDTLATTSVSIEKTTIAGLTTSWGDNAPASHIAYRVGNLIVMNVNLAITGTYSGTTGWVNLWNMPYSLIKTGETLNVPYMVNIGRNTSGNVVTVLNGVAIYIENGQNLTMGVTGQIVCSILS